MFFVGVHKLVLKFYGKAQNFLKKLLILFTYFFRFSIIDNAAFRIDMVSNYSGNGANDHVYFENWVSKFGGNVKMKAQSLYFSKSGNLEKIAEVIARDMQCKCDKIPPAYPCDSENIAFIGVESYSSNPDPKLMDFIKTMNPQRARHVAIYAVSSDGTGGAEKVIETLKANKVDVCSNVLKLAAPKAMFGLGGPKITDEHVNTAKKWAKEIVNSL